MVVSEAQRRALHERLVEVMGVDQADVLMEYLPPGGWGDVARRSDLDHLERLMNMKMESLETRLTSRIDRIEAKFDAKFDSFGGELRADMAKLSRSVTVSSAALVLSVVGSLVTALVTLPR